MSTKSTGNPCPNPPYAPLIQAQAIIAVLHIDGCAKPSFELHHGYVVSLLEVADDLLDKVLAGLEGGAA